MAEFVDERRTDEWEVMTPDGWKDFGGIGKTVEYDVYEVLFDSDVTIKCADTHIFMHGHTEVLCKDLAPGDIVSGDGGDRVVVSVTKTTDKEQMYDLLDVDGHVYYTDGVTSHNSASVSAFALWYSCFHANKNIGIVSNKAEAAKSFLSRLKEMYERLPVWIKPGADGWAQTTIEFENGTKIYTAATSKDSFRGEPMAMLIADEFAFVEPPWKADQFWASTYPTISASQASRIIIISTPNGMYNKFHEIYSGAVEKKNSFVSLKFDYTHVPGRDAKWAKEQLSNLGPIKFAQEFSGEFIGSSNTVLDGATIERLFKRKVEPMYNEMGGKFRGWEKPKPGAVYVMGVDTAKGTGENSSVIQIFKIESIKPVRFAQVAVWEDAFTDVYSFAAVVDKMSAYYNNAHMMVENNGEGSAVVQRLWWEYENENLINTGGKERDLGIRATHKTKNLAVLLMKKLIEDGSILINDPRTIEQLADFQDLGNNRFGGKNINDDLVSAMYWAFYILEQEVFDESYTFVDAGGKDDEEIWGFLSDADEGGDDTDYTDTSWLTSD